MNKAQKKALIDKVKDGKNAIVKSFKISTNKAGRITFKYELVQEHTTYSPNIETLCEEEIKYAKQTIKFYKSLKELK